METDPRMVAKLAAERADENLRFRSFLKRSSLGIEELDAIVHRLYEEVAAQIDCQACGNCCHEALPELREQDVGRLAEGLNLSREALIEKFLVPGEDEGTHTFGERPCCNAVAEHWRQAHPASSPAVSSSSSATVRRGGDL